MADEELDLTEKWTDRRPKPCSNCGNVTKWHHGVDRLRPEGHRTFMCADCADDEDMDDARRAVDE